MFPTLCDMGIPVIVHRNKLRGFSDHSHDYLVHEKWIYDTDMLDYLSSSEHTAAQHILTNLILSVWRNLPAMAVTVHKLYLHWVLVHQRWLLSFYVQDVQTGKDRKGIQSLSSLCGSVGCAVQLETRRSRIQPPPRLATLFHGDWLWNIFCGHSLLSADSKRAVVSFWQKNVHNTG